MQHNAMQYSVHWLQHNMINDGYFQSWSLLVVVAYDLSACSLSLFHCILIALHSALHCIAGGGVARVEIYDHDDAIGIPDADDFLGQIELPLGGKGLKAAALELKSKPYMLTVCNSAFKIMDFAFKMMNLVLKMTNLI